MTWAGDHKLTFFPLGALPDVLQHVVRAESHFKVHLSLKLDLCNVIG
jgi:hypothetical protein